MIEQSPATRSSASGGAAAPEAAPRKPTRTRPEFEAAGNSMPLEGRISLAAALGATLMSVAGNASIRLPD